MKGKLTRVTGLMSGSSLDGVDLALCQFSRDAPGWSYGILAAETLPYPPAVRDELERAHLYTPVEIEALDSRLGSHYGQLLNQFHARQGITPDLVSSHGHTLLHEPDRGITLQAGNGRIMADVTGLTVVNDFRSADVAQGGQGAPLVPVGDRLLFGEYGACLNIGGIANISFEVPHTGRIAYDLCPANMLLNWIAGLKALPMDEGGAMARAGRVDQNLLDALNGMDFFRIPPPKSLGREWFLEHLLPLIGSSGLGENDLMATAAEHIAIQIAGGIRASKAEKVLVTGGGALNSRLIERISVHAPDRLVIPDPVLVKYKEALIFALLGLLRILGEVNCLSSVTGGKQDLSAGIIHRK